MLRFLIHLFIGVVCIGLDRRFSIIGLSDLSAWIFFAILLALASGEILLKAGRQEAEADLEAAAHLRRLHLLCLQGRSFREAVEFLAAGQSGEEQPLLCRLHRDLEEGMEVRKASRKFARRLSSPLCASFLEKLSSPPGQFPLLELEEAEDRARDRLRPGEANGLNNGLLFIQGFWMAVGLALYAYAGFTLYRYIALVTGGLFSVLHIAPQP